MLAAFEYLFFSNEHGMSKPDVRVFQHTLAALDVRAPEAAHVGDIQRTDIAGAQAAGMAAVHFIGANNHDAAALHGGPHRKALRRAAGGARRPHVCRLLRTAAGEARRVRSQRRIAGAFVILLLAFAVLAAALAFGAFGSLDQRIYAGRATIGNAVFDAAAAAFGWAGRVVGPGICRPRSQQGSFSSSRAIGGMLPICSPPWCARAPSACCSSSPSGARRPSGGSGGMRPVGLRLPQRAHDECHGVRRSARPGRLADALALAGARRRLPLRARHGLRRASTRAVHWPSDVAGGSAHGRGRGARRPPADSGGRGEARSEGARAGGAAGPARARTRRRRRPRESSFSTGATRSWSTTGRSPGPWPRGPRSAPWTGRRTRCAACARGYRVLVATNADDSGERDVLAALARVGLDGLVDGVVSSRDVGAAQARRALLPRGPATRRPRRPAPVRRTAPSWSATRGSTTWPALRPPGWRAVWFNPSKSRRPPGAAAPDAEIRRLSELPQALAEAGGRGARCAAAPRGLVCAESRPPQRLPHGSDSSRSVVRPRRRAWR